MINMAAVLARLPALDERRLQLWIEQHWVRPVQSSGQPVFAEIDMARLHLILDLETLDVGEAAMPVVLSLLDQLHETRRLIHRVVDALDPSDADRLRQRLFDR